VLCHAVTSELRELGQMQGTVKKFQEDAPVDYLTSTITVFLVLIFSIVLSVSALFLLTQLDNVRCWAAVGDSFDDGFSSVQLATGLGVGGTGFIDFAVEYTLPASEGALDRVQLHGPVELGIDPGATPVAYTFCGDTVSCVDLETETCLREKKPAGCGRIANKARSLGPNDTPVQPDGRIVHLASMLEDHPQRFYINISSTSSPNGIHRGFIGPICRL